METKEIEIINGKGDILLVAPHGVDDDDDNTGALVRKMANELGCYAVINEAYRRNDEDNGEKPDKENMVINCNSIKQVEKHLKDEFLKPILYFKNRIVKAHGQALVLWIHGINDENIDEEAMAFYSIGKNEKVNRETLKNYQPLHMVLGVGQPRRNTASNKTIGELRTALSRDPKKCSAFLAVDGSNYCGWSKDNMNQLFRSDDHTDDKAQSIQLEIKNTGFRDKGNIEKTVNILTKALKELNKPDPIVREVKVSSIRYSGETYRKYIFRETESNDKELNDMLLEDMRGLTDSINKNGLIQPIVLLKVGKHYEILCGYRRFQALKKLGIPWIQANVNDRLNRATHDRRNRASSKRSKTFSDSPFKLVFFTSFRGWFFTGFLTIFMWRF